VRRLPVEAVVARVLKIGLALSAAVIAVGLVMQEFAIRHESARGARFVAGPGSYPHGVSGVLAGLGHGSGSAVLEVGLALLVFTPIAAVATAALVYRRNGDGRFALVGAAVLGVLVLSSLVGLGVI